MKLYAALLMFACAAPLAAQSGRTVSPANSDPAAVRQVAAKSAKELYDEAAGYLRAKAAEFETKKIPYSDQLLERTRIEQKQLAARYAAMLTARPDLAGDDLYYTGMLHWIAGNIDGTADALTKFGAEADAASERLQPSRAILSVALAKLGKTDDAETVFARYNSGSPKKYAEIARVEAELAKAYQAKNDADKMIPHAVAAYTTAKIMLNDPATRTRGLDEILDAAMLVFESYRDAGRRDDADKALDEMIATAGKTDSANFYYYAADQKIKFMIDTGRKPQAMKYYAAIDADISRQLTSKAAKDDVTTRFRKRQRQYELLGETVPDLVNVDQWFPGEKKQLSDYRGKVLLLDFWATWCGPCIEAFPHLREWAAAHKDDGLEILGVTHYYGSAYGNPQKPADELEYIKTFGKRYGLQYDIAVVKDQSMQAHFGAMALPTAAIIDRKGVVRYIESGTSPLRIEQMRLMILKLLAEK